MVSIISDRLRPIIEFVLEVEKLKTVTRKVKPLTLDRYENSAEHSWQIALLAAALEKYASAPVDINHVIKMLLLHDIGEIETGDTMAFIEEGLAERKAGELACVTRIFGMLPDTGQTFLDLWLEFEKAESPESKFAHAVDRAMPVILNLNNNGQSWRENGISYERVIKRVEGQITEGCPQLWNYLCEELSKAKDRGFFADYPAI